MAAIGLRNLTKSFTPERGRTVAAINGLSLEISAGEFFVVIGPSGTGKTTLLRLIAGLETPDGGDVLLNGAASTHLAPGQRNVAMVFQNPSLFPHLSVRENLGFHYLATGKAIPEEELQRVAALLRIEALLSRRPHELSGGEQQRIALGRALLQKPAALLLDEPFSQLDRETRTQLRFELQRIHRALRCTIIYVTHDQMEALALADRIAVMRNGAIEQIGIPPEIYGNPATLFVARFVGNAPVNEISGSIRDGVFEGAVGSQIIRLDAVGARDARNALLLLRPEQLAICERAHAHFSAAVDWIEFAGHEQRASLRVGDAQLQTLLKADTRVRVGDTIGLRVAASAFTCFDAATGLRL